MACAMLYNDFLMFTSCSEYSLCAFEINSAAEFYLLFTVSKALRSVLMFSHRGKPAQPLFPCFPETQRISHCSSLLLDSEAFKQG